MKDLTITKHHFLFLLNWTSYFGPENVVTLFCSAWQHVGGLGGFALSAITVISIPFCCNAQKRSHFNIISALLQGKLTKWNFISCLINTQFASAFCQISLCWTYSFNCYYREWAQNANSPLVPPVRYTLTHIFASQPRCPSRKSKEGHKTEELSW